MVLENDQILPLTIWGRSKIRHRISVISCPSDLSYFVTGSWDGNLLIWDFRDGEASDLRPRWIVTGATTSVTAIACFGDFFISCHSNGTVCHFEMPYGRLLKRATDHNYVHTNAAAVGRDQVMCSGYYQDIVVLDAYCLNIVIVLLSREQGDWMSSFRFYTKENDVHIQGITSSGFMKTWSLNDADNGVCLENSLSPLNVLHSKSMALHIQKRLILLVTTSQVLVFDVAVHLIFKHTATEALEGGDFLNDRVLFWTKTGTVFECDVKTKSVLKLCRLDATEIHVPGNRLVVKNGRTFLIAADIKGTVSVVRLEPTEKRTTVTEIRISEAAQTETKGLFDDYGPVTSSIHVAVLNKLIAGCENGDVLVFPATELIVSYFFNRPEPDRIILSGHKASVRCIVHPYSQQQRYLENVLLTGSDDFTVCVWDIFKLTLQHTFSVHSGPVLRILVPPNNSRTVCSVAADHSVAILNLPLRRCTFLASQHPYPVVAIRWKPHHNVLLVKCFDGTVFVWELQTGVLDRIVSGLAAEEVVYDCDQPDEDSLWNFYTNPLVDEIPRQPLQIAVDRNNAPVLVSGFLASHNADAFLVLINVTQLCVYLRSIFPDVKKTNGEIERKVSTVSGTQLIPYAQLAISLIHPWTRDPAVDAVCREELGLIEPWTRFLFDHYSNQSFSLRHPTNVDRSPTLFDFVALTALSHVLGRFSFRPETSETDTKAWQSVVKFFDSQIENNKNTSVYAMVAELWLTRSNAVRSAVRGILPNRLKNWNGLLEKYSRFLPGRLQIISGDPTAVAVVLSGLLTINGVPTEIVAALKILLTSRGVDAYLVETAIDFLGRGFAVWEEDLPLDEALVAVFERCAEFPNSDVVLTARAALKSIAKTRLNQLIAHLKFLTKTLHPVFEPAKVEILALLRELLVDAPVGIVGLLSDIVEVLLACIDPGRLKESELSALLRVWLPQLHHHVVGQRVAVGMPDGKIVMHDLRARRAHIFPAHDAAIQAVQFSPDGKILMVLAMSGAGSLWQLTHGLFDLGVGQFRFRNILNFSTALPPVATLKSIAVQWRDQKTITIEALNAKENEPPTVLTINI